MQRVRAVRLAVGSILVISFTTTENSSLTEAKCFDNCLCLTTFKGAEAKVLESQAVQAFLRSLPDNIPYKLLWVELGELDAVYLQAE